MSYPGAMIAWMMCSTKVTLPPAMVEELRRGEGSYDYDSSWVFECEIDVGHPGAHLSMGQSYGTDARETWVSWQQSSEPELVELEPCDAVNGDDEDDPLCILPMGHFGRHSDADGRW